MWSRLVEDLERACEELQERGGEHGLGKAYTIE